MAENSGGTATTSRKRGSGRPFEKGQSGNPGGRPKEQINVQALAREKTELAIETLAAIAGNQKAKEAARVAACVALLDRGWGRAAQPIDVDLDESWESLLAKAKAVSRSAQAPVQ